LDKVQPVRLYKVKQSDGNIQGRIINSFLDGYEDIVTPEKLNYFDKIKVINNPIEKLIDKKNLRRRNKTKSKQKIPKHLATYLSKSVGKQIFNARKEISSSINRLKVGWKSNTKTDQKKIAKLANTIDKDINKTLKKLRNKKPKIARRKVKNSIKKQKYVQTLRKDYLGKNIFL